MGVVTNRRAKVHQRWAIRGRLGPGSLMTLRFSDGIVPDLRLGSTRRCNCGHTGEVISSIKVRPFPLTLDLFSAVLL